MMNFPTTDADIATALAETPRLGLGVHLVLTSGRPLTPPDEIPSITTAEGTFLSLDQFTARLGQIDPAEAKKEWRAQIEKFMRAAGHKPTHLDSHHHSSYFSEGLFRAMLELAAEYGCAIRYATYQTPTGNMDGLPPESVQAARDYAPRLMAEFKPRTTDAFFASFYDKHATLEEFKRIVDSLPASGVFEVMCHPGYADAALIAGSVYARQRESELEVLTSEALKGVLADRGVQLVSFAAV
jgi:predicted glycoside hydrolase/deacetylase ChbG (UPF0249 family)